MKSNYLQPDKPALSNGTFFSMRGRLLVPAPRQAARQRYLPGVNVNLLCLFSAWWATNNWTKSLQGRSVLTESAGNRKKTLLGFFVYRFARAYNIFYISVTPCNRKQRTKLDKYYSYDFRHKLLNKSALFILAYLFVWKPVVHINSLYLAQQSFLWSLQDFGAKWPMLYLW